MQVCTTLQTDNHTSTPPLLFLQAGCPSCHPTNRVKALKAYSQPDSVGGSSSIACHCRYCSNCLCLASLFCGAFVKLHAVEHSRVHPSILLLWWRRLGCGSWETSDRLYVFYCWRLLHNESSLLSLHTRLRGWGLFCLGLSLMVRQHFIYTYVIDCVVKSGHTFCVNCVKKKFSVILLSLVM